MSHNDAPVALWRRPLKSGIGTPLVVLLHGRGADEHDLFSLTQRFPVQLRYVSLRGLVRVEGGGYSWFESRAAARPVALSMYAAVRTLRAWLDDPNAAEPRAPTFLLGFSAGMMMAGALLLDDPERFAGAILLSGAISLGSGNRAERGRLAGVPVFYGRGTLDDVIPAGLAAQSEAYLRERSGADLTIHQYAHAHAVSNREVDDITAWLKERT